MVLVQLRKLGDKFRRKVRIERIIHTRELMGQVDRDWGLLSEVEHLSEGVVGLWMGLARCVTLGFRGNREQRSLLGSW